MLRAALRVAAWQRSRGRHAVAGVRAATRTESDTLGDVEVPAAALWGASTARALENFRVSGARLPPRVIASLGLVKVGVRTLLAAPMLQLTAPPRPSAGCCCQSQLGAWHSAAALVGRNPGSRRPGARAKLFCADDCGLSSKCCWAWRTQVAAGVLDEHFPVDVFQTGRCELVAATCRLLLLTVRGVVHDAKRHKQQHEWCGCVRPSQLRRLGTCYGS
jgi:hypothetical protein